jgi:hypothetical protein
LRTRLHPITAIELGRGFTWVSVGPGIRVIARHFVEPNGAGSRATLWSAYDITRSLGATTGSVFELNVTN